MLHNILKILPFVFLPFIASVQAQTTEELLNQYASVKSTPCATKIFADALRAHATEVSEADEESVVQMWAKTTMHEPSVLKQVLQCPEITSTPEEQTIIFTPIVYKFPMGRELTINYRTQPKMLKQLLLLATKPSLPTDEVSPQLMNPNDPAKYMNTEPAWYAIMVVQHDSLSEFVGRDKNNTVSVKYIDENIDSIYPHGYHCTSKSAWANDNDTINKVVHEVVDLKDDTNDYYVAGDINLEWVMYAEIAADVIITVVTFGGGAAVSAAAKGARATRTAKNLIQSMKVLTKLDDVKKYMNIARQIAQHSDDIAKLEKNIANAEKYEKALKNAEKLRKAGKDATKYEKEAKEILEAARKVDSTTTADVLKNADKLRDQQKNLEKSIKTLEKEAHELEKTSKNVAEYKKQSDALADVMKLRREMRAFRRPQTGNIISKALKSFKGYKNSTKILDKTARTARAGMSTRSAKMGDWLFQTTLKHGSRLAKFESQVGFLYGVASFLGDMYDKTSTTSKEFSNGIEFKPLGLLSADDLEGQENVVNYGMWFMWVGNSTDPADDDAAYLQAMDFAEKFSYQLNEYQKKHGAQCNVDIYVVRPIIRLDETDVNNPKGQMFYLFMNEIPWTTSEQFKTQVKNIEAWERTQSQLEEQDPQHKHTSPNQSNQQQNLSAIDFNWNKTLLMFGNKQIIFNA